MDWFDAKEALASGEAQPVALYCADAADLTRRTQRRRQCEQQQGTRMALSMMGLVDRQLTQQRRRHGVGLVALMGLGEELAFNLGGAQSHVARDQFRIGVADDARSRDS